MRAFKNIVSTLALSTIVVLPAIAQSSSAPESDSRIESTIKNSYNFRTYLAGDDVSIQSSNGVVTLTGKVTNDYHRAVAEETAVDVAGVKRVDNELEVMNNPGTSSESSMTPGQPGWTEGSSSNSSASTSQTPSVNSDAWITSKVKGALAEHKNVDAGDTDVRTVSGIVTLTGRADSEAQKQLATEYAQDVEGVKEVRNDMVVVNEPSEPHRTVGESIDDTSITAQIKTSLLFHRATHALGTKVVTRNGIVTLYGEARTQAEKDLATKLAEDTSGVKRVENLMVVRP